MCIICHHPAGKKIPRDMEDLLENCYWSNSDGAGIMYRNQDGNIRIRKGYMTFTEFMTAWKNLNFQDSDEFVLHFRWATHGEVDEATTHPFPVTFSRSEIKKVHWDGPYAMAHNGVITNIPDRKGFSDSQVFDMEYLAPIGDRIFSDKKLQNLIEMAIHGDRMILWHKDYGVIRLGRWEKDKGLFWSNSGYKHCNWTSTYKKNFCSCGGYLYTASNGEKYCYVCGKSVMEEHKKLPSISYSSYVVANRKVYDKKR